MVSPSKAQQQQPQENRSRETDRCSHVRIQKGPKPLEKKTFYLDIKNHVLSNKLEAKIKELGGKIELFLVKNISLVVSDRVDKSGQASGDKFKWGWPSGGSGGLPSLRSVEVATPIPTPPTPSPAAESPLANSTNLRGSAPRLKSRADAMLERALTQPQQYSVDPLKNARTWGIPIWATSKLQAWLEKIYTSLKETYNFKQNQQGNTSKEPNVKHLKSPYIKFESLQRDTRPVFLELTAWPRLNFEGEPGSCPFDTNQRDSKDTKPIKRDIKENKTNLASKQQVKDKDMTRRPRGGATRTRRTEQLVSGYCEICRTDYRDLNKHVSSDQHLNFVRNDDNFLSLDTLISAGASVEAFLNFNRSKEISKDCSLFPNVGRNLRNVVLPEDKGDATPKSDVVNYSSDNINMVQCNGARRNLDLKLNSSHNLRTRAKHESGHLLRSKGSPWHEVEKSDKFYDKFEGFTIKKRAKGTIWIEEDDPDDKCLNEDAFKVDKAHHFKESKSPNDVIVTNTEGKDCLNTTNSNDHSQNVSFEDLKSDIKKVYDLDCLPKPEKIDGSKQVPSSNNTVSNETDLPVENKIHINGQELREEKVRKNNKSICTEEAYPVDGLQRCSRNIKSPSIAEKNQTNSTKFNGQSNGNTDEMKIEQFETKLNPKTPNVGETKTKDENSKVQKPSRRGGRTSRGRQRLSVEERLIEDNRAYYKVEVLGNKLRSSILPSSLTPTLVKDTDTETRKDEVGKKDDEPSSEKPVVVRFKRVRKSELSLLSDEAETFMFGESKRDDTSDCSDNDQTSVLPRDTESECDATTDSLVLESSVNSTASSRDEVAEEDSQDSVSLGRARKRRRTQAESLIKDNEDYYKFQTPGSRLRYQAPVTGVKDSQEPSIPPTPVEPLKEENRLQMETAEPTSYAAKPSPEVEKMQFSFEAIPKSEPWYQTYQRQDEGAEFWHCFSEGDNQKPFLLPYEIENFHEMLLRTIGRGDSARKRGRGRGRFSMGRSPRKSPRCHASTLAIMSTIIRKREQLQSPNLSNVDEEPNCTRSWATTPRPESGSGSKVDSDEDLREIAKNIDDMLSGKHLVDLEDSFETELGTAVELNMVHHHIPKGPPSNLLELLDNCQDLNCLENSSCASSECGEVVNTESPLKRRKRRKNRTGWPGNKLRKKLQAKLSSDPDFEGENVPDPKIGNSRLSESVKTEVTSSDIRDTDVTDVEKNHLARSNKLGERGIPDKLIEQIRSGRTSPDLSASSVFCASAKNESSSQKSKHFTDTDKSSSVDDESSADTSKSESGLPINDPSVTKIGRDSSKSARITGDSVKNVQNHEQSCKRSNQAVVVPRKRQNTAPVTRKLERRSTSASELTDSCSATETHNCLYKKDTHSVATSKKRSTSSVTLKRRPNDDSTSETTTHDSDQEDENRLIVCKRDSQSMTISKSQRIAGNLSKRRHYKEMSSETHDSDVGEENCENSFAKDQSAISVLQKQSNANPTSKKRQREETTSSDVHTSDFEDENSCKKDTNLIVTSRKQQSAKKRSRKETISSEARDSDIEFTFSMTQRVSPVVSSVEFENRRSSIEFQPVVRMTKIDDQVDMDNGVLSVTVASNRRLRSSTSPRSTLHPPTKQFRNTRAQFGRWIKNS